MNTDFAIRPAPEGAYVEGMFCVLCGSHDGIDYQLLNGRILVCMVCETCTVCSPYQLRDRIKQKVRILEDVLEMQQHQLEHLRRAIDSDIQRPPITEMHVPGLTGHA